MEEENKDEGIKDLLKKIAENTNQLIETKQAKKFSLPFRAKFLGKRKVRKGWTIAQILRHNGNVDFIKVKTEDGTIKIDGFPRIGTIDYQLHYKNKPWIIIPEWSLAPYNPIIDEKTTEEKENLSMVGRRLILAKLEGEQIKQKPKMGGMIGWIILIAIIGGVGWYLFKGGKIF
jgi:hypothetical protein